MASRDAKGKRKDTKGSLQSDRTISMDLSRSAAQEHASSSDASFGGNVPTEGIVLGAEEEALITRTMGALAEAIDKIPITSQHVPTRANRSKSPDPEDHSDKAKHQKLENYLTGMHYGLSKGEERLAVYRALKAEKFDVAKAVRSIMATIEFRKRQNLNRMVLFPSLVPTRGYNERLVCETMNLPFLEDWQLTAALVAPTPLIPVTSSAAVGEKGRLRFTAGNELDAYYQATYSDYMDDTEPGSPAGAVTVPSPCSLEATHRTTAGTVAQGRKNHVTELDSKGPATQSSGALSASRSHQSPAVVDSREFGLGPVHSSGTTDGKSGSASGAAAGGSRRERGVRELRSENATDDAMRSKEKTPSHADSSASATTAGTSVAPGEQSASPPPSKGLLSRFLSHVNPFSRAEQPEQPPRKALHDGEDGGDAVERTNAVFSGTLKPSESAGQHSAGGGDGHGSGSAADGSDKATSKSHFTGNHGASTAGVTDSAELVDQQTALFVNADGAARALTGGPMMCYSEALDFHALLQPIVNAVLRYLPTCIHYWDREGHPIMYIKLAPLRARRLVKDLFKLTPVSTEPKALALLYHAYSLEVMSQLIRFNNLKNKRDNEIRAALLSEQPSPLTPGSHRLKEKTILPAKQPINACVVIMDCAKVRFRKLMYKPLLQIVKPLISLDQKHYSELLHHIYVVNCNSAVNFSYLAVRGVICEETRAKITFCTKRNTTETLRQVIDGDLLPSEFGGRCQCPGGCNPVYVAPTDASSIASSTSYLESRHPEADSVSESLALSATMESTRNMIQQRLNCTVEKMMVAPRKKSTLTFAVSAHEEIFWEFRCKNQRSVEFSVVYIPMDGEGGLFSLADPARVKDGASHYICPHPGTVVMEWHNKHSKVHKINIHAKVYREGSAPGAGTPPSGY